MQGYAPACRDEAFAGAREQFAETEEWLATEAAGLQHAELEEQLEARGRELMRRLFQGHLDLLAAREERRDDVAGTDGVVRTRAERGRTRPLVTRFGQVRVSRIAYRSPGRANVHLLDAALNLPEEKHSHGLRKLAAVEAARGSVEAAQAAVARATGVRIGKRQLEELARRAAADVEAFCLHRLIEPAPEGYPLVLTFDGKGIVMLPGALRPATARAAASAESKLATRLSPGEKNGRKRMAELACVYDAVPVPRTPEDIISTPAQKRRKKAQAAKPTDKGKPREPRASSRRRWRGGGSRRRPAHSNRCPRHLPRVAARLPRGRRAAQRGRRRGPGLFLPGRPGRLHAAVTLALARPRGRMVPWPRLAAGTAPRAA